jgi:hypothetical protein
MLVLAAALQHMQVQGRCRCNLFSAIPNPHCHGDTNYAPPPQGRCNLQLRNECHGKRATHLPSMLVQHYGRSDT